MYHEVAAALAGPVRARRCGCCRASCPRTELPKGGDHPERGVAFGIDENNLAPVFVDFETDPFFLVFGESESGKTALLRLLAKQISRAVPADKAMIVVGDYRRALLGAIPEPPAQVRADVQLHGGAHERAPGPDAAPGAGTRRHPAAAARPQLVVRADDLHHRRRLRPGRHLQRQPARRR